MNQQVCLIVASLISVLGGSAGYSIIESFHEIPDLDADVPTIIRNHGYPVETHIVVTDDGYILQIFRIPYGKLNATNQFKGDERKQPIILQHGLLGDSSCFVTDSKSSLAFILADEGYDVWLPNFRGTNYGHAHRKLSPSQYEFWNFSWDEMAKYDLTSIFELVFAITEQRFLYIGHSMGTTTFFAHMATYPEDAKYCKAMYALAPVGYMNHMQGALDLLVPFANDLEWVLRALGIGEFLPANPITHLIIKYGCTVSKAVSFVCENIMFALLGFDEFGFDMSAFKMIVAHLPSPSSARTIVQYGQEKSAGKFQHYDFGADGNKVKYGTPQPPIYDISQIQVPIAIYWGANDFLSQAKDVERLWSELPHKISRYDVPAKSFNHLDFLWAKNIKTLLYDRLLLDLKLFC